MVVSIPDILQKIKRLSSNRIGETILIISIFALGNIGSYILGSTNNILTENEPVIIAGDIETYEDVMSRVNTSTGLVFGSINGTKFYYDNCSGGKSIKNENKIWFETIAEAIAAGYTQATNCKP